MPFFLIFPKNNKSPRLCKRLQGIFAGFVGNLFNNQVRICRICGKYHKTIDNFYLLLYNLIKQRIRIEFDFLIVCLFSCLLSFVLHIILSFDLRVLFLRTPFFYLFSQKSYGNPRKNVL